MVNPTKLFMKNYLIFNDFNLLNQDVTGSLCCIVCMHKDWKTCFRPLQALQQLPERPDRSLNIRVTKKRSIFLVFETQLVYTQIQTNLFWFSFPAEKWRWRYTFVHLHIWLPCWISSRLRPSWLNKNAVEKLCDLTRNWLAPSEA